MNALSRTLFTMDLQLTSAIILTLLCVTTIKAQVQCPTKWNQYATDQKRTTCLWLSQQEKASWINAHAFCHLMGSSLVDVSDFYMNVRLANLITQFGVTGKYWINANDVEDDGTFKSTVSGKGLTYNNFIGGQTILDPAKNCVSIDQKGLWTIDACKTENHFICQKKP
ncbi:macrophage mannose receptor 1-like isoform X1 [Mya arenaria]|uniref:macrophage mannose receptor 1-like isoform X1 n=1 Tax=Mya arenaria TaxID=6604 RepID=UPI0022E4E9F4|nr:macrophage mannose receptor 1-like isoform X1 [Mya arenaria]